MGITLIRKSLPLDQRYDAPVALVLAGGAVSGGAFKVGGLKALNDFLINRKVTDFDMYVGLSAGALIASALANGVGPEEMLRSLEGKSHRFTQLKPWDFYWPNFEEYITRPIAFLLHLLRFWPETFYHLAVEFPRIARELRRNFQLFLENPAQVEIEEILESLIQYLERSVDIPDPLRELLPTAPFDSRRIERFFRINVERNGDFNDFTELYRKRGKKLYICATNLDTADRVVFGYDEINDVPISKAIEASCAIPGFFRPVRINEVDHVDGGVRKTANIDVAIEKGAKLIIVYNPFRPYVHPNPQLSEKLRHRLKLKRIRDDGLFSIMNQTLRTLLHTRLHLGIEQYRRDPYFDGDIILIEPSETDLKFFNINPIAFWMRIPSALHGFRSCLLAIEERFEEVRSIFQVYGIEISRYFIREELRRLKQAEMKENYPEIEELLEHEEKRKDIRLVQRGE